MKRSRAVIECAREFAKPLIKRRTAPGPTVGSLRRRDMSGVRGEADVPLPAAERQQSANTARCRRSRPSGSPCRITRHRAFVSGTGIGAVRFEVQH